MARPDTRRRIRFGVGFFYDKSDSLKAVITPSERPLHPNGGFTGVSHETHDRPGQEWHPTESDNANSLALRPNGEERTSVEQHPAENDHDPLQSRYASKKEAAQSAVEENFALSEDAAHRASEGVRDNLERRAVDVHEPSFFSHDATGGQHELERLAASVRSVQREEAAARLPRASQLPSVPGLPPVDNGFWPQRSPEPVEMRSRLRGPLTLIKIIILVVSIFAVPVAYYFWVGGWDPISKPPPEMMSFASKFGVPPPKPSNQEETIIDLNDEPWPPAKGEMPSDRLKLRSKFSMPPRSSSDEETATARGGDPETPVAPAKPEPPRAKSSPGETVARLQPGPPRAQDPPSSPAVRALDVEQIKILMKQGEQFFAAGDVVTARIAFQRAAEAGDAKAAIALGATYDPSVLAKLGVVGMNPDVAKARSWYEKAEKLGSPDAKRRLELLADRFK
jgi:hypothetical protein